MSCSANTTMRMAYASTDGWNKGEGRRLVERRDVGWGCDRYGTVDGSDFLVCLFCCVIFVVFVFTKGLDFTVDGAGFIRRGVVVGGGFRSLVHCGRYAQRGV